LRNLPGQSDNIRLTVAFAESYGLIESSGVVAGQFMLITADANSIGCFIKKQPIFYRKRELK